MRAASGPTEKVNYRAQGEVLQVAATLVPARSRDLAALGKLSIARASRVEPDEAGRWWADLSPVGGPSLGPFAALEALAAELRWLGRTGSARDLRPGLTLQNQF